MAGAKRWAEARRQDGLARRLIRQIIREIVRKILPNIVVARRTAAGRLRPASVRMLAAVEAKALGATVIGGWYLAERTFGT
jgi:hypothetical protein